MEPEKLPENIEELIEEKVEKRVQEELERRESQTKAENNDNHISRRRFIKKAGVGALGLGALSLLPSASALDVRSSTGLEVFDDGNEFLQVQSDEIDVLGGADLDLNSNNIKNVNQLNGQDADNLGVTDHSNLSNVTSGQHHSRYTDSEAVSAGESAGFTDMGDYSTNGSRDFLGNGDGRVLVTYTDGSGNPDNMVLNFGDDYSGGVNIRGTLDNNGNRVATQNWVENSATASNADTVDSKHAEALGLTLRPSTSVNQANGMFSVASDYEGDLLAPSGTFDIYSGVINPNFGDDTLNAEGEVKIYWEDGTTTTLQITADDRILVLPQCRNVDKITIYNANDSMAVDHNIIYR